MFKQLSPNIKGSITRSISQTFERYMKEIEWDEKRFDITHFVFMWESYIKEKTLWYKKLPEYVINSPQFHAEVANKINEVIERMLTEPATEEQIQRIEALQKGKKKKYTYSCKAEAQFVEDLLKSNQ